MPRVIGQPVTITQRMQAARIVKELRDQNSLSAVAERLALLKTYVVCIEKMTKAPNRGPVGYAAPHWTIRHVLDWHRLVMKA